MAFGEEPDGFKSISSRITGNGRWSINHEAIFSFSGKFYMTHFRVGSTESQEERPYQDEPAEVECVEVKPVTITVLR